MLLGLQCCTLGRTVQKYLKVCIIQLRHYKEIYIYNKRFSYRHDIDSTRLHVYQTNKVDTNPPNVKYMYQWQMPLLHALSRVSQKGI